MFLCLGRLLFRGLIPICVVLRPSRFLWFAHCLANRNEAMKNDFLVIKHPPYDVKLIPNALDPIEDSHLLSDRVVLIFRVLSSLAFFSLAQISRPDPLTPP